MSRKKQVKRMIKLRPAREEDLPILNAYCYNEGMDNLPSVEYVTVAVDQDDDPVGFIRIANGDCDAAGTASSDADDASDDKATADVSNSASRAPSEIAHVNPIVVNPYWRGYGIGHMLIDDAMAKYGELRLVSRGSSLDFYQRLGFKDIPWEDIDMSLVDDCDGCEMRKECNPQPVRLTL